MDEIVKPNVWLSARDLMDHHRRIEKFEIMAKGDKLEDPEDELLEEKKSGNNINNLRDLLSLERVAPSNSRSRGIYETEEHRVRIIKSVGKCWTGCGYTEAGVMYLNPHEALLFMEMNRLEVTYDEVIMSLEQAYAIFLGGSDYDLSWEEYMVYSYLIRCGYFVFLPDPEVDLEKYENSQLRNQSKTEDEMIWCVLKENLHLPYSFDFIKTNYNLYEKTKAAMKKNFAAISGDDNDSIKEPPMKKFKSLNEEQEGNFLDILKAETEYLSYEEIFKKFTFITRNEFSNPTEEEKKLNFSFDVYYQKTKFKRTEQLADYRLLVLSTNDKFPTNAQLEVLRKSQPYQVPIVIAIVSQGIQFSICTF